MGSQFGIAQLVYNNSVIPSPSIPLILDTPENDPNYVEFPYQTMVSKEVFSSRGMGL